MKTSPSILAVAFAAAVLAAGARAQMPSSPAPTVPGSLTPGSGEGAINPASALQPTQWVYAPRLPTPQELTDVAKARGFAIARMEQTATQITVAYDVPGGQTSVVGYVLLPSAAASTTATVVASPAPRIIYRPSRPVVFYDPFVYDPWYYYPPVRFGIGLGWGGHHGGHHHRGHHHGGWHRGGHPGRGRR